MAKINYISIAKKVAQTEIKELKKINKVFDKSFVKAVDLLSSCKGKIITAGIGKSGLIARKISATLSSVGASSFYLNPGEANHGDLGQVDKKDILIIFSYSGNTSEITNLLKYANRFGIKVIGIASKKNSMLLKASDVKILLPIVKEADPTRMVPTSSTSITLLFGDCLSVAVMNKIKFSKEKFKIFHPGGNIGKSLLLAKDIMITGKKIPIIDIKKTIGQALKIINLKKLGIVVVIKKGCIAGLITDGDIRRTMEKLPKKTTLEKLMTKKPIIISEDTPAAKALAIMNKKKVTCLLVSKDKDLKKKKSIKLLGIIHIHFLLSHGIR
jgi:arabinose-5-phosphate isomerase